MLCWHASWLYSWHRLPKDWKEFRRLVQRISVEAGRIEQAAVKEDTAELLNAAQQMWVEGCLSCHEQFR